MVGGILTLSPARLYAAPMASVLRSLGVLVLLLGAGACSIRSLDEPRAELSEQERSRVAGQVESALADEEWEVAWNQAVDGGLDRARLEAVALATLRARDARGEAMVEELREAYGGLTEEGAREAAVIAEALSGEGQWKWSARVLVWTAADAPAYRRAWDLYDQAPAKKASDVLEVILEAREAADEESE